MTGRAPLTFVMAHCMALSAVAPAVAQGFVHFESPHTHPIEISADGTRLLVINTPAGRLEVFDLSPAGIPARRGSVAVGIEPVSVRLRNATEAWVVNRVSDSVSIVDVAGMRVTDTIDVGDEPADLVFAGSGGRAFVSLGQEDAIAVIDPNAPHATHGRVPIVGKEPRALATDGTRVYAAIFQSGNATTVVPAHLVSSPAHSPYAGAPNPPPNHGTGFDPPLNPALPTAPPTGVIVRRDSKGRWRDDQGADWSAAVTWRVADHDVAVIDAHTLLAEHAGGAFTTPAALAALPGGRALAVGTDSRNEIRFESHVQGVFVRSIAAIVDAEGPSIAPPSDLNPHLDYSVATLPIEIRRLSIGDPRGVAVDSSGTHAYVAGMGSSNVCKIEIASGSRVATAPAATGATGIAIDEFRGLLYVASRFEGTITVLRTDTLDHVHTARHFDPTPLAVRRGRPFLYDTHLTSGLGQASCATCHFDARTDGLAWDLGNPAAAMASFDQVCLTPDGPAGELDCAPWHPMKGPMVTQTLVGMSGTEPFHWRGDRAYIATFAHTAHRLQGADGDMTEEQLKHMQDFLSSIAQSPSPLRTLEGEYLEEVQGGNPLAGGEIFHSIGAGGLSCAQCHGGPLGSGAFVVRQDVSGAAQLFAVPHLSGVRDKAGLRSTDAHDLVRGSGYGHDGTFPTLVHFLGPTGNHFNGGIPGGDQGVRDVVAYLLSWDASAHPDASGNPHVGTHPSVGAQVTVRADRPDAVARRNRMLAVSARGHADLVAHATVGAEERAYRCEEGTVASDRADEPTTVDALDALAASGTPVTWTLVPLTTGTRVIDLDGDGARNGDERDACTDPTDPASVPGGSASCRADLAGADGHVDGSDLSALLAGWSLGSALTDINCDGQVDGADLAELLAAWGPCSAGD